MILKSGVDTEVTAQDNLYVTPNTFWNKAFPLFNTAASLSLTFAKPWQFINQGYINKLKAFLIFLTDICTFS